MLHKLRISASIGAVCVLGLAFLAAAAALAASARLIREPDTAITYEAKEPTLIPVWSGGALMVIERNGTQYRMFTAFDRGGVVVSSFALEVPESKKIYVEGFGRGPDGAAAVCGFAWDAQGREGNFLAVIGPDGRKSKIVRTNPYVPYALTVAPDGSVWTVGIEMINRDSHARGLDPGKGVIRHFDSAGNMLGDFMPTNKVQSFAGIIPEGATTGFISASTDRVGWYPEFGKSYIEISLPDGSIRQFPAVSQEHGRARPHGLALTDNRGTFVSATVYPPGAAKGTESAFEFDRGQEQWLPVQLPWGTAAPPQTVHLYGHDGNTLVLTTEDHFHINFFTLR